MGFWAGLGVLVPFPFYYVLWKYPQKWVDLCGKGNDPSKIMAVYQLLGESGTYYGVRFGKNIPWVTEFPFGYVRDPQYVGSVMSLVACLSWVPFTYIFLWSIGYLFMIHVESEEDPSTRAKPLI